MTEGPADRPRWASAVPLLILFYLGATWPLVIVFGKFAIGEGIGPLSYTATTIAGAGVLMCALAAARGELPPLSKAHVKYLLLAAVVRLVLPSTIIFTAIAHVPVGIMSIVLVTTPLFAYLLALAIRHERFVAPRFAGIALGLCGVVLLLAPKGSLPAPETAGWVALAYIVPVCYASSYLFIERRRPKTGSSVGLVAGTLMAAAAMLVAIAVALEDVHVLWPPFTLGELAMFGHMVITSICFLGQFELIRMSGAVFTSQHAYVSTMAGIGWGMVFFDETHSGWIWLALILVLAGVALVSQRPRPAAVAPSGS